jgi:hypothetical protein
MGYRPEKATGGKGDDEEWRGYADSKGVQSGDGWGPSAPPLYPPSHDALSDLFDAEDEKEAGARDMVDDRSTARRTCGSGIQVEPISALDMSVGSISVGAIESGVARGAASVGLVLAARGGTVVVEELVAYGPADFSRCVDVGDVLRLVDSEKVHTTEEALLRLSGEDGSEATLLLERHGADGRPQWVEATIRRSNFYDDRAIDIARS